MRPVLMLLPGLCCDAAVWAHQVNALEDQFHCVVPHWGLRDSITAMAQQVLDEAPSARFSLAGHSMGGRVALEVMRLAAPRVQCLALLSTGAQPLAAAEAGAKERAGRMTLLELARTQGMRAMAEQWARGMLHPQCLCGPVFTQVLDMFERSSVEQFAAQIKALLQRPDATPLLSSLSCPTLVLTGQQDAWSGPAQHAAMAAAIPSAHLLIVEQCGHMCTLEQPQAVAVALSRCLQGLSQ